jgi:hypothetical protein
MGKKEDRCVRFVLFSLGKMCLFFGLVEPTDVVDGNVIVGCAELWAHVIMKNQHLRNKDAIL